jgi:hypothetical protein
LYAVIEIATTATRTRAAAPANILALDGRLQAASLRPETEPLMSNRTDSSCGISAVHGMVSLHRVHCTQILTIFRIRPPAPGLAGNFPAAARGSCCGPPSADPINLDHRSRSSRPSRPTGSTGPGGPRGPCPATPGRGCAAAPARPAIELELHFNLS